MPKKPEPKFKVESDEDLGHEDFGFGYSLPRAFKAEITRRSLPCDIEFRAVLEEGRYRIDWFTARRRGGDSVTLEMLRDIAVASLLSEATESLLSEAGGYEESQDRAWDPEADLKYAAVLYRVAHACGRPPTIEVADKLGISRATAGRWIAEARHRKFLGPAIDRRPGEKKPAKRGKGGSRWPR